MLLRNTSCGIKLIRPIVYLPTFVIFTNINTIRCKIVPLGSNTSMEKLFLLLVGALEVFNRDGLKHVRYNVLDVF